ncbi:MAG: hypothetical protein WC764_03005 [Candidatus Paceibacterota bacterium]|jgi:hypothetical protein
MTPDEEKSKLEQVEQTLNKKDDRYFFRRRKGLAAVKPVAHEDWHDALPEQDIPMKKHTFATRFFLVSLIFFASAIAFAFYKMQGGGNLVSNQNIDITVTGPLSIKGGDEVQLQLQIVNNNNVPLEVSELVIEYPAGTRLSDNQTKETTRVTKNLGDIAPHQVINDTFRAILFGEEKSDKEIKIQLEYHLPGSGAVYTRDVSYHIVIDSAPVTLRISSPDAVNSGDETTLNVTIDSNTGKLIPNLKLKMNYPPGFIFTKATPAPISGTTNVWTLGDVSASSSRDIVITGTMTGQENDTKAFQAIAGISTGANIKNVDLVYNSLFQKIAIKKPFLGLAIALNDSVEDPSVVEGETPMQATFSWANNTDITLTDCALTVQTGGAIDRRSVRVDTAGSYFSSKNTLVWTANGLDKFQVVNPGDSGTQNVTFASSPLLTDGVPLRLPMITLQGTFVCTKVGDSTTKDYQLTTQVFRTIKINSNAQFSASARYYTGPFTNTGPFPPKGDSDTTFTIIWSLTNTSNDIDNATVTATLPAYASWVDKTAGDGTMAYDQGSKQVTWTIGTLKAGVGYESPVKQTSFQVSVKPSVNAAGSFVDIIGPSTFAGIDDFTKAERKSIKETMTSELKFDPGLPRDMSGKVQ